jgi:hypothetical protein
VCPNDTLRAPATTDTATDAALGRVCPECGEPVRRVPPRSLVPWAAHGLPVPQWSHTDGEPLCPVLGPDGYRPADPA